MGGRSTADRIHEEILDRGRDLLNHVEGYLRVL
jgi:hypothetical protein